MHNKDIFVHSYEKSVIEANRKIWKNDNTDYKDGYIIVFHELPYEFEFCIWENIASKGLQKKEGLPIVAFQNFDSRKACEELDQSFGILSTEVDYSETDNAKRLAAEITDSIFPERKKLFELVYRDIDCGEFIYDEIIRNQAGKSFDWSDIDRNTFENHVRQAIIYIDAAYELFEKFPPRYIITIEWIYIKGLMVKVAQKLGAKILQVSIDYPSSFALIDPARKIGSDIKIDDILRMNIEHSSQSQLDENDLFVYKSSFFDDKWIRNNGKKNVFIMLHALSDVPRTACHHHVYEDYTDWYVDTIKYIRNISSVNWYIKDHPHSACYKQSKYVKEIFRKYRSDNIFWCNKAISGQIIKDAADCIITVSGDVAAEYWSYGIPTISLADTHYTDSGISYSMRSLEEYHNTLDNIMNLKKPDQDSVANAKKFMKAYMSLYESDDKLTEIMIDIRRKSLNAFTKVDFSAFPVHYEFAVRYIDYLRNYNILESSCYRLDGLYEVK